MKNIFTLIFVLFLHTAWGADYYFSAASGDDSRSAAEAQNPSTPWKTLDKLNSYFSHLKPGDAVLLKRGETFFGSIIVGKSGKAGLPIVVGAYGTGNKPVITGLTQVTKWVAARNGVYETTVPYSGKNLNIVMLNNALEPMGRYPDKGYLTLEAHSGNTITGKKLKTANWTGAELVLRTVRWKLDRYKILSQSGNKIHFSGSYAQDNYGYFIQNSVKTLDKLGEWYYHPSTGKLSMYFGSASPAAFRVTVSSVDDVIYSYRNKYVLFDNLTVDGANNYGLNIRSGNNFTVKNCDVLHSGIDGVNFIGHAFFTIENCNVLNSFNNGINAASSSPNAVVRNNTVRNTYYVAGMGQSGDIQGMGIKINANGLAEHNTVINSGYLGIRFDGDNCVVKNNLIDTFCFVKDDGGAIYTYNGRPNITYKGRKLTDNIILNGLGAPEGTDTKNSSAEGIYLDDNTNGVEITGNTISNCNRGIYLHNSREIVIKNNTSFNNNSGQLNMKHDDMGQPIRNNTITNNIFFSKISRQIVSSITSIKEDIDKTARFDSNYYARPINEGVTIYNSYINESGKKVAGSYDLNTWKSQYNHDKFSKMSGRQIMPFKIKDLTGKNKYIRGSFNTKKEAKLWANACKASWDNAGVLDGGCLKVVPREKTSSVVIGIGNISAAKRYILKFSVKGSSSMSISAYLRSANYKPVTAPEYRTVKTARSENEILFSPSSNQSNSSLVLSVDDNSTYYVDNVQLYEADATITNPDDSIRFVYNSDPESKTVSLKGNYVDVKNNNYSNSIVLHPYTSAILIKDNSAKNNTENTAPEVTLTSPSVNADYKASATINISADASDTDGKVMKVDFYNGTTLLHTELNAKYSWDWKNVPAGNYTIIAKATDNSGNITTSESVTVSVNAPSSQSKDNTAPEVNLTSPSVNADYKASATINISADANDADGKVTKVDFYNGTTLLHTELNAKYSWDWKNVPAGNYTIIAKATDNSGNVTASASVSVSVNASQSQGEANALPKVNITSPEINANYKKSAKIRITANASDADGKITKVEFYNGTTLLHTELGAPYKWDWKNVQEGNYTITAVATDNKGGVTKSEGVSISVTAKKANHRAAGSVNTAVAKNDNAATAADKDTVQVKNNQYSFNLKREVTDKAKPAMYSAKVFPNPAVSKIQISVDGLPLNNQKALLSITNLSGIIIKNIPVILSGKTIETDVTSLTPGMYLINVQSGNLVISAKFIKN